MQEQWKLSRSIIFISCLLSLFISSGIQAQSWRPDWNYSNYPPYPYANPPFSPYTGYQQPYPMPPAYYPYPYQQPEQPSASEQPATSKTSPTPASKSALSKRKVNFVNQIKPIIEQENKRLIKQRYRVLNTLILLNRGYQLKAQDAQWLESMARKYKLKGDPLQDIYSRDELLDKVDIIPVSLALAQAANESAWGQSRFSREANNLFGIWTFNKKKGLKPKDRDEDKKHLVRKFDSVDESIQYYMLTLNSHPAYQKMRNIRKALREKEQPLTGEALAAGLEKYSQKGDEYVQLIKNLIQQNGWQQIDLNA